MNFDLTDDEKTLANRVAALASDPSLPDPQALDSAPVAELEKALRLWLARLGEAGYLSAAVGRDRQAEQVALLAAQKELALVSPWLLFATELGRLVASLVADLGTDGQKREWLTPMTSGERIPCVAFSEPASGSTPPDLDTVARASSQGWVLSGEKSQVSLAPLADLLAVFARTEQGVQVFLVRRDDGGVGIGERIATLGYNALVTSPVKLTEVRLPADRRLGSPGPDPGAELRIAEDRALTAASLGIIARCIDEARRAADRPRAHAKPPAGYQAVRFRLAEMLTSAQTAEILAYRARAAEATGDREAEPLRLCAKVFATETACQVSDQALQILASSGYRIDHPVARAVRDARLGTIAGHTSEVARMAIADGVLKRC